MRTPEYLIKRNLILTLLLVHTVIILALLLLTAVRRVRLAAIMNFGYLSSLLVGLIVFCRFHMRTKWIPICFLGILTFFIVISILAMFIEAFALNMPSHERPFVFYVNIPIVIDIGFAITYTVIYCKYLKSASEHDAPPSVVNDV